MEFDETPRFWYPRVALDAWIEFSSRTVELRPLECQENLIFLSLSLSLSVMFSSSPFLLPFLFHFFYFFSFLFSLSYAPNILPFVCSHHIFSISPFTSLFLILIHRIFLSFFFLYFIFSSISFSSFSLFYLSFGLHQPNGPKM